MSCHEPVKARGGLVSCMYCPDCRSRRSAVWALRLSDENKEWSRSCFLTLTVAPDPREYWRKYCHDKELDPNIYRFPLKNDGDIPSAVRVSRRDLQLFFKRMRKHGATFKYYAVGEYGEASARAHYHVLLFGLDVRDRALIERAWCFGIVDIGRIEPASLRYVTGYVMKAPLGRLRLHAERTLQYPPFSVMSRGLGAKGSVARRHTILTQGVVRVGSVAVTPPRYYLRKLDDDSKKAYLLSRRSRLLQAALDRVAEGKMYLPSPQDLADRAKVSRADFNARRKTRGVI